MTNPDFSFISKFFFPVFLLILGLVIVSGSILSVQAGTVKVVKRFGGTTNRVLKPGLNFKFPFAESTVTLSTKTVIYETTSAEKQIQSDANYKDFPVDTNTSDGQAVDIFYTIRFAINSDKAVWIVDNIGDENDLVEKIVKAESRIWIRNIPREYTAEALYAGGGVQEAQIKIEEKLRPTFEKNGLYLDSVGIREIKFNDQYVQAIEQKQIEQVRVQTEKHRADQAVEQRRRLETEAEARSFEQRVQSATLTNQFLQKLWIERWDGKLPTYITGDASQFLLQLPR